MNYSQFELFLLLHSRLTAVLIVPVCVTVTVVAYEVNCAAYCTSCGRSTVLIMLLEALSHTVPPEINE